MSAVFSFDSIGSITASISDSSTNTFIPGEPITLKLCEKPRQQKSSSEITILVRNHAGIVVDSQQRTFSRASNDSNCLSVNMPNSRLGYYRAEISTDGIGVPSPLGSRPAGYQTYAIVSDPRARKRTPEERTFFGMQGAFNKDNDVLALLGVRWVLGGYSWRKLGAYWQSKTPDSLQGIDGIPSYDWVRTYKTGAPWEVYTLPTLFMIDPVAHKPFIRQSTVAKHTGALSPLGEKAWQQYCGSVARSYMHKYPNRTRRIYQITWEPVPPWGFKGSPEELVKIYKIAYLTIHKIDDKAMIIGPTTAPLNKKVLEWNRLLLEAGLNRYLDGFSIHPYVGFPPRFPPEEHGFLENVRLVRIMLSNYFPDDFPIFGTEQGYEAEATVESELSQALGIIRSNLILLGEGWAMNIAFYNHDFYRPGSHIKTGGYGFYYALDPSVDFGDKMISPKPVAPAYSAMTSLLEGHRSIGLVAGLKGTAMGYIYEGDNDIVIAAWDYGNNPAVVEIAVEADEVEIYDMMGNMIKREVVKDHLVTQLNNEPLYIRYRKD